MLDFREGQLRDELKSGGTQSANISMINRRYNGSASARALAENQHKTHKNWDRIRISWLTPSAISVGAKRRCFDFICHEFCLCSSLLRF